MHRMRVALIVFVALAGLVTACGRRVAVPKKYYVIELPSLAAESAESTGPLIDAACEIERVAIAPAFDGVRIALRTRTHEITYYSHHLWAANPAQSLTDQLEADVRSRGIFGASGYRLWNIVADYRIETDVTHLEVVEGDNSLTAHLQVQFTLLDVSSGERRVYHAADRRRALAGNDLNLYATAISEMFGFELERFANKIVNALAGEAKSP